MIDSDGNPVKATENGKQVEAYECVGKTEVTKNVERPADTNVSTVRKNSRTATLSLEAYGDSDITKVYYIIDDKSTTAKAITDFWDSTTKKLENSVKTISVSGNKVSNYEVSSALAEKTSYTISYVLENSYGSRSDVKTATIAKEDAKKLNDVTAVKEPTLVETVGTTNPLTFSWTAPANKPTEEGAVSYTVNLIKDTKVIKSATSIDTHYDLTVNSETGRIDEGTYQIEIKANGTKNGEYTESGVVTSKEVKVSKLAKVTNVALTTNDENKGVITWTDSENNVDDVKTYTVNVYALDENGKITGSAINTILATDKLEAVTNTKLDPNRRYIAKVVANSKASQQYIYNDSEEVTSGEVFYLGTLAKPKRANVGNSVKTVKTTNSIRLAVEPIEVPGKNTSYSVEVYKVNDSVTEPYTKDSTRNGIKLEETVNDNGHSLTPKQYTVNITGLQTKETYAFILVANVDGKEVKSSISDSIKTDAAEPVITNYTVTKDGKEALAANSGKVAVDTNSKLIAINGNEYKYSDLIYSANNLSRNALIVSKLEAGDVVTISGDVVTVTLNNRLTARDFTDTDLSKVTLNLNENNKIAKTLTIKEVKGLNLNGNGSIYDISRVAKGSIIANSGVEVTGDVAKDAKLKIVAGATVIVNKVTLSSNLDTEVKVKSGKLTISKTGPTQVTAKFTVSKEAPIDFSNVKLENLSDAKLKEIYGDNVKTVTTYLAGFASFNDKDVKLTVNKGSKEVTLTIDSTETWNPTTEIEYK